MPLELDLPLAGVAVAGALHIAGERRLAAVRARPRSRDERWRAFSFYAGLLTVYAALGSPLDALAHRLFWAHMVQHLLLMAVAAPLVVLGGPWMSIWRPLPLRARRRVARAVGKGRWWRPARALARLLGRPAAAWLAFTVNLGLWHVPLLYDSTLRDQGLHDLEHALFLILGVLLWAQVLRSPPLRLRLAPLERVYFVVAATAASWLLAIVLALYPTPLYQAYAHLGHRPGGLSALSDQQIAAGIMLGPGSVPMTIFVFVGLYRWLGDDERRRTAGTLAASSPDGRGR
jgi:cytochrome c oxidase assembly factor CtaG